MWIEENGKKEECGGKVLVNDFRGSGIHAKPATPHRDLPIEILQRDDPWRRVMSHE